MKFRRLCSHSEIHSCLHSCKIQSQIKHFPIETKTNLFTDKLMQVYKWTIFCIQRKSFDKKSFEKHTLRFLDRNYFGCLLSYDRIPNFYNACAMMSYHNVNIWYKAEGWLYCRQVILTWTCSDWTNNAFRYFAISIIFWRKIRPEHFHTLDIISKKKLSHNRSQSSIS